MHMEESELRRLAVNYLNNRFRKSKIVVPFFDFHKQGMTLCSYFKKIYFGEDLQKFPYLDALEIRPDIVGVIALPESDLWVYILGEAKTKKVEIRDFRQCMNYMSVAHPYKGYLFFSEDVTEEVRRNILADNHKFLGLNKWGRLATRRINLLHFKRGRFLNGRIGL